MPRHEEGTPITQFSDETAAAEPAAERAAGPGLVRPGTADAAAGASPDEDGSGRDAGGAPAAPFKMLDPRVVTVNRIAGAISGAVFGALYFVGAVVCFFAAPWPLWIRALALFSWLPVASLLLWLAVKWPLIEYRRWQYRVDSQGIEIRSGVVWRETVAVARSRVQHIDVSQGPIERSYGLATLSIYTAGTQYSKIDLPGLEHSAALIVRDTLLPKDAERGV